MKLEKPNHSHKEKYENCVNKWKNLEDINNISPVVFFKGNTFKEFLNNIFIRANLPDNEMPAQLYFFINNNEIIGGVDIRFNLNNPIYAQRYGNIGYGIIPDQRKKGYATKMLSLALLECRNIGLNKVLITCDTDNIASSKVIEKNGGTLEKILDIDNKQISRYWINL